ELELLPADPLREERSHGRVVHGMPEMIGAGRLSEIGLDAEVHEKILFDLALMGIDPHYAADPEVLNHYEAHQAAPFSASAALEARASGWTASIRRRVGPLRGMPRASEGRAHRKSSLSWFSVTAGRDPCA